MTADERAEWDRAARNYVAQCVGVDSATVSEEHVRDAVAELDELRRKTTQNLAGDLAGCVPARTVDADDSELTEQERRVARAHVDDAPVAMATEARMRTGYAWAAVDVRALSNYVRGILERADGRLRALMLSQTPHATRDDFCRNAGSLTFVQEAGTRVLFRVHGSFGVTCEFGDEGELLRYVFT